MLVTLNAKLALNTPIVTEENVHQIEMPKHGQFVIAHLDGTKTLKWHALNVTLNVNLVQSLLITVLLVLKTELMPQFVIVHMELSKMVMLCALIVTHNVKLVKDQEMLVQFVKEKEPHHQNAQFHHPKPNQPLLKMFQTDPLLESLVMINVILVNNPLTTVWLVMLTEMTPLSQPVYVMMDSMKKTESVLNVHTNV
jgi:hypothetical protein